jgi:large subunit ribosomal protein L24
MHVKKDDKVIILTGKDKGKTGTVVKSLPLQNKVIVSGINILKVHQKPRKSGEKGQIIDKSMPIHVSNVRKTKESKK